MDLCLLFVAVDKPGVLQWIKDNAETMQAYHKEQLTYHQVCILFIFMILWFFFLSTHY